MPYSAHSNFETPSERTVVWRYMDFPKLMDFLERQALYFSRIDTLEDPREGRLTPRAKELLRQREQGDGERIINAFELLRPTILVNGWHSGKGESAAMWGLYSQRGYGIAICSSIGRLKRALASTQQQVMIGRIKYVDSRRFLQEDLGNLLALCLFQDRMYAHEREVRLVVGPENVESATSGAMLPNLPKGMPVRVDVAMVIKEILVDPHAQPWLRELVQKLLSRFGIPRPVRQSELFLIQD